MTTSTAPNHTTSLARMAPAAQAVLASVNAITRDPARITAALEKAQEHFHIVSPVSSCPVLPEGVSVAMSTVLIDPRGNDVYPIPGSDKVGIGKSGLDRIAMAAGISWSPSESRRLDDGRDPHFASYLAVGHYPAWDGSRATVMATKEVALRDGDPAVVAMWDRYREKLAAWEKGGKQGYAPKNPEGELRQARLFVLAMAESKAKNRCVRSLGIRTSYPKAELAKPFLVARAIFTGETSDPELRRQFAVMTAQAMLGARAQLYGSPVVDRFALPPAGHPAPPVGTVVDHDTDGVIDADFEPAPSPRPSREREPSEAPASAPSPGAGAPPPSGWQCRDCGADNAAARTTCSQCDLPRDGELAGPEAGEAAAALARSGLTIPGGRSKGTPIEDAEDRDLQYWSGRIEGDLAAGTARNPDRDRRLAEGMRAVLNSRGA